MPLFNTTGNLVEAIKETGASYKILDRTPTGEPIVDVTVGGDRGPAILITAGSHATEQAGVSAAVELIERLDTEHEVHIIPSRDPMGLNGYSHLLSRVLGREIKLESFDELEKILEEEGEIVHMEDDMILALISDFGFATKRPDPRGDSSQLYLLKRLKEIQHSNPEILEPFKGRRIFVPPGQPDIPGSRNFRRAYTLVVGPKGRLLHLNRFFDTSWAPVEVRCTRQIMEETDPGLMFDLHETQLINDRFYFGINRHGTDREWERELGASIREATKSAGAKFASDDDIARVKNITVANPSENVPKKLGDTKRLDEGCYLYPDPSAGSEGLNATHLAANNHGLAIGTETGMYGEFGSRVRILSTVVEKGISKFEERHC